MVQLLYVFQPENLMLQSKTSDRLKIIDFGLSRQLVGNAESRELLGTAEFVGEWNKIR